MVEKDRGKTSPLREIAFDTLYEPIITAGWDSEQGRLLRERLETSDEVTDVLHEIGVADGISEYAAKYWPVLRDGAQMEKEGEVRFGIKRLRDESEDVPFECNVLNVWANSETAPDTNRRDAINLVFYSPEWLGDTGGLPHAPAPLQDPPHIRAAKGKLRNLVEQSPFVVVKSKPSAPLPPSE